MTEKKAKASEAEATEQAESKVEAAPEAAKPKFDYAVADGKSIVCKKGVIGPGDEMKTEWLHGSKATADELVKRGLLVKG